MSNINPNCDGAHCRPGYKEVRRLYPPVSSTGSGGGDLYLCLPCFANENMRRYQRAKKTSRAEDWPQLHWSTAKVVFDKHGKPFDARKANNATGEPDDQVY
jgi:hypothetical protein